MIDIAHKFPIPTADQENVEQGLAVLWAQFESNKKNRATLEPILAEAVEPGILDVLMGRGYVYESDGALHFFPAGESLARDVVRRHRLAERLLEDVLTLPEDRVESNACRLEHIITADVDAAICTLLGHPQACPHGLAIPRAACCERSALHANAIVIPLCELREGEAARISYLSPQHRPELQRFLSLGIVPGADIQVDQCQPAFVITVGNMVLAIDKTLARYIYVRRKTTGEPLKPLAEPSRTSRLRRFLFNKVLFTAFLLP